MIETLIYMSLFCVGLAISLEQGMIFHKPYKWMDRNIQKKWIRKPLFTCIYCFSSFWGSIIYWTRQMVLHTEYTPKELIVYWIILTICCVCVNGVIYSGLKQEYNNSK